MNKERTLESDRNDYVKHAQEFWVQLGAKGAALAKRETEAANAIIQYWADKAALRDLLLPLLCHQVESVRYAAAADLLKHDGPPESASVLRKVANNPDNGFLGSAAQLLLMKRGIPLVETS